MGGLVEWPLKKRCALATRFPSGPRGDEDQQFQASRAGIGDRMRDVRRRQRNRPDHGIRNGRFIEAARQVLATFSVAAQKLQVCRASVVKQPLI